MNIPYIIREDNVRVWVGDDIKSFHISSRIGKKIVQAISNGNFDEVARLAYEKIPERCIIKDNALVCGSTQIQGELYKAVLLYLRRAIDPAPLLRFAERLVAGGDKITIKMLPAYVLYHGMPISEDGSFIAFTTDPNQYPIEFGPESTIRQKGIAHPLEIDPAYAIYQASDLDLGTGRFLPPPEEKDAAADNKGARREAVLKYMKRARKRKSKNPTGLEIPDFKYCYIKSGKYHVEKKIAGKTVTIGTYENIHDAEQAVYDLCEAILDDRLLEYATDAVRRRFEQRLP